MYGLYQIERKLASDLLDFSVYTESLSVEYIGLTYGAQKPGFFTKRRVTHRKIGKKPGFFVGVRKS